MKTGNKILFAASGLIFFITAAIIISMTIIFYRSGIIVVKKSSSEFFTEKYDFREFTSLEVIGVANVEIDQSNVSSVSITASEKRFNHIKTEIINDTLSIKIDTIALDKKNKSIIKISVPSLKKINCMGASKLLFSGFDESRMVIETNGYNEIKGVDNRIENIELSGKGIINVDLDTSQVVNAMLDLDGLGTVNLNMIGGKLKGRLCNMITIDYKGTVSSVNIEKSDNSGVVTND